MGSKAAPKGLGTEARKLWRGITGTYELRADELRVLEDACREVDLIERLNEQVSDPKLKFIVKGSMGQPVENPLVKEIRNHRMVVKNLLGSLKLPDEVGGAERSSQAREAANVRWRRGA